MGIRHNFAIWLMAKYYLHYFFYHTTSPFLIKKMKLKHSIGKRNKCIEKQIGLESKLFIYRKKIALN